MKKLSKYAKIMAISGGAFMIAGTFTIAFGASNLSVLFFTVSFILINALLMAPDEERYVKKENTYIEL